MAGKDVENLLIAGGQDKKILVRYNVPGSRQEFVALAAGDGYHFTVEELDAVLKDRATSSKKAATRPGGRSGGDDPRRLVTRPS